MAYTDPTGGSTYVPGGGGDDSDDQLDQIRDRERRQERNRQRDQEQYSDPVNDIDDQEEPTDPFVDDSGNPAQFGIDIVENAVEMGASLEDALSISGTSAYWSSRLSGNASDDDPDQQVAGLQIGPVHVLLVLAALALLAREVL
jgi:hypothetical protein